MCYVGYAVWEWRERGRVGERTGNKIRWGGQWKKQLTRQWTGQWTEQWTGH